MNMLTLKLVRLKIRKVQCRLNGNIPDEWSIPNIRLSQMVNAGNQGMEYDVNVIQNVALLVDPRCCKLFEYLQ